MYKYIAKCGGERSWPSGGANDSLGDTRRSASAL